MQRDQAQRQLELLERIAKSLEKKKVKLNKIVQHIF